MPESKLVVLQSNKKGYSQSPAITVIEDTDHPISLIYSSTRKALEDSLEGAEERALRKYGHLTSPEIGKKIASDITEKLETSFGGVVIMHSLAYELPPIYLEVKLKFMRIFPRDYEVGEAIVKEAKTCISKLEPSFKCYLRTK
jgi:hypothetical protein